MFLCVELVLGECGMIVRWCGIQSNLVYVLVLSVFLL